MALTLYPVPGKEKSKLICNAFAAGAPKHATGAVFFGTEGVMQAFQRAKQGTWWYIDNAYTDPQRQLYFRVTKNALQVDPLLPPPDGIYDNRRTGLREWWEAGTKTSGIILPGQCENQFGHYPDLPQRQLRDSDGRRFARLGITVKDWRHKPDGKIIVIPQSDDFMKSTLGRKGAWLRETVDKLNAWGYGPRIRVRPWLRDKKTAYVELHKDLDDAALVVTWSSASAITALYEGIPAISESGAAHALTGPLTQEQVAQPLMPSLEDRTRFLQILADNQMTLEEMRNGTAWRWLESNQ